MKTLVMFTVLCFLAGLYVRFLMWFTDLGQLFY